MNRCFLCFLGWISVCGLASAQLRVPQLGFARFSDGSVHAIRGVAANLLVDAAVMGVADCVSFADSGGLVSSNGLIRLMSADGKVLGEYQSDEPLSILDIDSSLTTAVVWLPGKHLLLNWNGNRFTATSVDDAAFGGAVIFVRLASANTAQFFVRLADSSVARLSVALPSGGLISSDVQPGISGMVFAQQGWVISQAPHGLVAELANGQRQTIELSKAELGVNDLTIERMSSNWLHVSSRSMGINWAINLSGAKASVWLLPPPVHEAAQ
jgi:hypothetical protein